MGFAMLPEKADSPMGTLWSHTDDGYVPVPLPAAFDATVGGVRAPSGTDVGFCVVPFRDGTRPSYALIVTADVHVRVNGQVVVGRLHILQHQDELVVGSQQIFFSAESTPVVEIYRHDDSGRRPRCPVCRAEIQDGQAVVRCPGCSRLFHQLEATETKPAKPCWTYSPACRFCEHPTSMSGEPTWRPDEEDSPDGRETGFGRLYF